jgi:sarcosine oxidase subunit beta
VKAGADGFTPDGFPLVDEWPGLDGLFVAVGMNGGGFKTAPAVGRLLATWVTTGVRDDLLAPYGAGRFLAVEQR